MIRRSKIKARPAIKRHQTSSQGKISSQASTPIVSQGSPGSEKNQNDDSLQDPNLPDSIPSLVQGSQPIQSSEENVTYNVSDKTPTAESSILAHSDRNSNTDDADSQTSKVAAKPHMARRRKLVACPTMAKKRQKTIHPDPKPENKTASVPAPLEITQSSPIHPTDVCASGVEAVAMPIPSPPQPTPVENDLDQSAVTLTTITTISLGAEEEVENSNQSYASLNTVDEWMIPGDENTEAQSHGSHHEQPNETTLTAAVARNSSLPPDEQTTSTNNSTELKILEPKKSENTSAAKNSHVSSKAKIISVTAKHRNSAMAKLRKLKKGQEDDEKWPELDQNFVSMSDLIFLNPPNKAGLKLGMNAQRESMEETMPEREKTPEPEPSTSAAPEEKEGDALPVPQIRIAEDGSVVIDEESLVMDTQKPPDRRAHTVYEIGREAIVNQCSFLRRPHAKTSRWSQQETDKFYRCLCIVGAEFSLMGAMFRSRSADDLRRKFKRERKINPTRVDTSLMHQHLSKWTDDMFEPKEGCEDNTEGLDVSTPPQETVK